jgi:hypothetical protein
MVLYVLDHPTVTLTMDRADRFLTPQHNCQRDDQLHKPIQERFNRKVRSFERVKETYAAGI